MKADVYLNLHKDCVSVRSRESETYGQVVSHESKVHMQDVEFIVQPAGQKKCRETRVKNVHAFVRGEWNENVKVLSGDYVTYNPFQHDYFFSPDVDAYVETAERVAVTRKGVYAKGLSTLDPND